MIKIIHSKSSKLMFILSYICIIKSQPHCQNNDVIVFQIRWYNQFTTTLSKQRCHSVSHQMV